MHSNLSKQPLKNVLKVPLYTGRSRSETLILNGLGLSWKFCRKNILPDFQSIEPILRSIEPGRKSLILLQPLDSNFTYNTHTLSESKQD